MTRSVTPTEPILRDVTALAVGDVIAAPWLPLRRAGRVIFTRRFRRRRGGEQWVFVAYETDTDMLDSTSFLVGEGVRLESAADPTGQLYGRAVDDPTPVGERIPPHTGAVTDGGLVDVQPEPLTPAPIAGHYEATVPGDPAEMCACGESFSTLGQLNRHVAAAMGKSAD